jgi:PKD domain/IPT/TIG domain
MKLLRNHRRFLIAVTLVAAAVALVVACSTKSPTEPSSTTPITPKVPPPVTTFAITVTANPNHLTIGQQTGSTITVSVVNVQTGTPPPDTTPITLTTTLGTFGSASGSSTVTLQLVHGQAQAVLFPGTAAGTATVTATGPAATSTTQYISGAAAVSIGSAGTFFLSSLSPTTGDPSGGIPVTIFGGGFLAPVSVSFGGSSAPVRSVSPGSIVVTLPPAATPVPVGSTQQVNVTVNNNVGGTQTASATLTNAFTYVPGGGGIQQPQVFSVTPASGTNDGGTQVTLTGQGFVAPVQVFFGSGSSASSFNGIEASVQSVTATQIIAISPPARGFGQDNTNVLVSILVKNVGTGFSTVVPSAFKYGSKVLITSLAPTQTVFNQPLKVTVFGQGFADPVAVGLAGVAAQVLAVSGTEIQVLSGIPRVTTCTDIKGPVHVTNINNGDSADGPDFVYIVPKTSVISVTPSSGGQSGGTLLTIHGVFPDPGSTVVLLGTQAASPVSGSTTDTLLVTTPPFTGTFPTQPCIGPGGVTGTMSVGQTVNVTVTDSVTTCTNTLTGAFTYLPNDTSCHAAPPTPPKASFTVSTAKGSLTALFTDTSSGNPTSWLWNFGDPASGGANTSASQNPNHTFSAAGTYVVTLTVSNAGGSSSASQFVTVPGT